MNTSPLWTITFLQKTERGGTPTHIVPLSSQPFLFFFSPVTISCSSSTTCAGSWPTVCSLFWHAVPHSLISISIPLCQYLRQSSSSPLPNSTFNLFHGSAHASGLFPCFYGNFCSSQFTSGTKSNTMLCLHCAFCLDFGPCENPFCANWQKKTASP